MAVCGKPIGFAANHPQKIQAGEIAKKAGRAEENRSQKAEDGGQKIKECKSIRAQGRRHKEKDNRRNTQDAIRKTSDDFILYLDRIYKIILLSRLILRRFVV